MSLQADITALLEDKYGATSGLNVQSCSGGDSHRSYQLEFIANGVSKKAFVKTNVLSLSPVLRSEYESLLILEEYPNLHYPKALSYYASPSSAYTLMSYHSMTPLQTESAVEFGRALAVHHQITSHRFGWSCDNYIGSTLQPNTWDDSWSNFFLNSRLLPQLVLAKQNGLSHSLLNKIEQIADNIHALLKGSEQQAVLLHGDLWAGNAAYDTEAQKAIFYDPAPYFGAREADLAMTHLFGGFPSSFYKAYHTKFPMLDGAHERYALYNLYHALNHFNLFGAAYRSLVSDLAIKAMN